MATEYVCDGLLKDKSKVFYSRQKIENRELKYEAEGVFEKDKKELYILTNTKVIAQYVGRHKEINVPDLRAKRG